MTRILVFTLLIAGLAAADLDVLRERVVTQIVAEGASSEKAGDLLGRLGADGAWPDLDFADATKAERPAQIHLDRLLLLALAHERPGPLHGSERVRQAVVRGMTHLLDIAEARGGNEIWGHNVWARVWGAPLTLARIHLLLLRHLPKELLDRSIAWSSVGIMPTGYSRRRNEKVLEDAADAVRGASLHLMLALAQGDAAGVALASGRMQATTAFTSKRQPEGLAADFSYHYHGRQLYTPGYAASHFGGLAEWSTLLAGTPWAFGPEATTFLRDGVLQGQQWFNRRGHWDPFASGREIGRGESIAQRYPWLERLAAFDPGHAVDYQAFIDHVAGRRDDVAVGTRIFWCSDFVAHRRPGFHVGLRMVSERTCIQETGNDENVQNLWLSQGATAFLVDGDELDALLPCWDFARIPGTTATRPRGRGELQTADWGQEGTTVFVGAAGDGNGAAAAMDVAWARDRKRHAPLRARKAWFCFEREIVALGSGISYAPKGDGQDPDFSPVATTVNQCLLRGPALGERGALAADGKAVDPGAWLWHDRVGYHLPAGQQARLMCDPAVKGDFKAVNPGRYGDGKPAERPRFLLTLEHGDRPADAGYAYMVAPGLDQEGFAAWRRGPLPLIVRNDAAVAAVWHPGERRGGVVVRDASAGAVALHDGLSVAVDTPAIIWIDAQRRTLAVTEPHATGTVRVTLGTTVVEVAGTGVKPVVKPLP